MTAGRMLYPDFALRETEFRDLGDGPSIGSAAAHLAASGWCSSTVEPADRAPIIAASSTRTSNALRDTPSATGVVTDGTDSD